MREILFRGKRIFDGKWVDGFIYKQYSAAKVEEWYIRAFETDFLVIPETVGQYTGLTDKNGKRIFEGDIIQSTETKETAIVQWFSEHSAFMVWCKSSNEVGFLYECEKSIIDVIGNIYDDKEILDVK